MMSSIAIRWLIDTAFAATLAVAVIVVCVIDRRLPEPGEPRQPGSRSLLNPTSAYDLRVAENKEEWIVQYGGNKESEAAVAAGLDWLARHQGKDGAWSNRSLRSGPAGICQPGAHCGGSGNDHPFAQTGLALLAFQAAGHFEFTKKAYSEAVHRGLDWLVEHQKKDGALAPRSNSDYYMYEHGMAAFALAESCAAAKALKRDPNPKYLEAAGRAVDFINSQQHYDGGWRYSGNRTERSDTSVSGWQVLAVKSAREAGIPVTQECVEGVRKFFRSCENGSDGRTGYTDGNPMTEATTGVGMLVHQFLLGQPQSDLVGKAAPFLANLAQQQWGKSRPSQADYYLWYNCTLAMYTAGGPDWERWNSIVRDLVISRQEKPEGCAQGSWPPNDRWGGTGGRIYSTALAVLILEVYYRFAKVGKN